MKPQRVLPAVPATIAVAVLLAGCGGSSKPASSPPAPAATTGAAAATTAAAPTSAAAASVPDPCSLLMTSAVQKALGVPMSDGESKTDGPPLGAHRCSWSSQGSPVRVFQITLQSDADITASGEDTQALYDQVKTQLTAAFHLAPEASLGSDALVGDANAYVLKDGVLLTTQINTQDKANARAELLTLTTGAVTQLGLG